MVILGDRGEGKSTFAVKTARETYEEKKKIVSCIHLFGIEYEYMTLEEITKFPKSLNDSLLITDELQEGAHAYDWMSKSSRDYVTLAGQLRKRHITWLILTQRMMNLPKRLRGQVDFIITIERNEENENYTDCAVFNQRLDFFEREIPVNKFTYFRPSNYIHFDTDEVILKDRSELSDEGLVKQAIHEKWLEAKSKGLTYDYAREATKALKQYHKNKGLN